MVVIKTSIFPASCEDVFGKLQKLKLLWSFGEGFRRSGAYQQPVHLQTKQEVMNNPGFMTPPVRCLETAIPEAGNHFMVYGISDMSSKAC